MTGRIIAGLLLALLTSGLLLADDPKLPTDPKEYDKLVSDTLKDVHNTGADLYNMSKDFAGTYRLYQGALLTVRPLLAHRPAAQKLIDNGLKMAEKEPNVAQQAFRLHESIEEVRKLLKTSGEPTPKTEINKKPTEKKTYELAPQPHEKKAGEKTTNPNPISAATNGLAGKVILKGMPLTAAEITVVSLDQPKPRVFTAVIKPDGSYSFTEPLPPGKYVVIVTAKTVPEKYQTTTTSGLTIEVKPGSSNVDINLP